MFSSDETDFESVVDFKFQIREVRKELNKYDGEISGIKAGIKRSIKMKWTGWWRRGGNCDGKKKQECGRRNKNDDMERNWFGFLRSSVLCFVVIIIETASM